MKTKFFALLFIFCLHCSVYALDFQPVPEDCSDSIDNNGNGQINEGCPQSAAFSVPSGTDQAAKVEDCVFAGYESAADALSETGNSVRRVVGTDINKSQIKCSGNATGDYYFWVLSYGDVTESGMWVNTSPLTAYPSNATLGSVLSKRATPAWQLTCASGSNLNFRDGVNSDCDRPITLAGDFDLYLRGRSGVVFICVFASTNLKATPICPSGTGVPSDYVILRTTNAITMDHADLNGANVMTFANSSNNNMATISVRALWKDDTVNRMYIQYQTNDADIVTAMTSNDGTFSTSEDHFDFRFRNGDTNQLTDLNLYQILGNFDPSFLDANFVGGTRTTATSLNASISVSGGKMLLSFDLPSGIAAGSKFLCNANARNRSTAGVTTYSHMHGTTTNAMGEIAQFGVCETSNTLTDPGSPDVTAPVVSACSALNVTSSSFIAQCTTDEAGTAWVEYDLDNDSAVAGADKITLGGSGVGATTFQLSVTGRPASTLHEWNIKVQDSAGNIGTGSIVDTTTASASTADLFASATGSGTACSSGSPCTPATLLSQIVAGQIGEFAAGTYQGAAEMIAPNTGISGTAINPITIRCATDGLCTLDGQGARRAIALNNNDWWIIEGFNAANGSCPVVQVGTGADNNILRRIVAWNASDTTACGASSVAFEVNNNTGNLLEDVAAFGTFRKGLEWFNSSSSSTFTLRRAFFLWSEHNATGGPNMGVSTTYNSYNGIFENIIANWNYVAAGDTQLYATIGNDRLDGPNFCANSKILGSIGYATNSDTITSWIGNMRVSNSVDCMELKNNVQFLGSNHSAKSNLSLPNLDSSRTGYSPANSHFLTNNTRIGGTASIGSDWTQTNNESGANVAAVSNIWNGGASTGARVCFRYENGTLTSTKLWPWPMDARIRAALTAAGKNPDTIFGGVGNGVTELMESIFGTIPAACTS